MQIYGPPVLSNQTYRIEEELGSGGGGIVYKAWHTGLQKYVVIKELKCGSAADIETQRNEVEALKNVKSAYLPQVHDFITETVRDESGREIRNPDGSTLKRVFTVMEFVEGESLDRALARGQKFSQPQVVKWYGQLASALKVIHRQNVAHRDIKPDNIMLTPEGNVCLIDFNAALVGGSDVRLISRSLGYASPEQYEIYERYKNSRHSPVHLGSTSAKVEEAKGTETELLQEETGAATARDIGTANLREGDGAAFQEKIGTELVTQDSQLTEIVPEDVPEDTADIQKTELVAPSAAAGVDWKRSDIYSLGAAMYHLLSGQCPPERARETIPLSKIGDFGEGILFIIEQSMRFVPEQRFESAEALEYAVRNIHKYDSRWKAAQARKIAAAVIFPLLFALCAGTALMGRSRMAQEKEERYYTAVYDIENGDEPQVSYDEALELYENRIEAYRAMAQRLWNDGELEACRSYIEENLGNIAELGTLRDEEQGFGTIYYILGNCYYYGSGGPDYRTAGLYFETAVEYVKENPMYYRDYAITLARLGEIGEAERAMEKAQVLNLAEDSLNLLDGEIAFAKEEYEEAEAYFEKVINFTDDDYVRYRAFHTTDEIYRKLGMPEESVRLLEGALDRIPLNCVPEMTERLADACVRCGEDARAISLFEELIQKGVPQFHLMQNLAILYENVGEYDSAASLLVQMADLFPGDYRVPMRQAWLEADRQGRLENESRDYALTKEYYDQAVILYQQNVKPGETDPEMQQLEDLIEQLRVNKWIE